MAKTLEYLSTSFSIILDLGEQHSILARFSKFWLRWNRNSPAYNKHHTKYLVYTSSHLLQMLAVKKSR